MDRSCLLIVPPLPEGRDLYGHAVRLAEVTGLQARDLRQRLSRPRCVLLCVLPELEPISAMAAEARGLGYAALALDERELRHGGGAPVARSARVDSKGLALLDRHGAPLLRADERARLLLVVGDLERIPRRTRQTSAAARMLETGRGRAGLRIFARGPQEWTGFALLSERFDYRSLGQPPAAGRMANFRRLLELLEQRTAQCDRDLTYGQADQPPARGVHTQLEAPAARNFELHARLVRSIWLRGLMQEG